MTMALPPNVSVFSITPGVALPARASRGLWVVAAGSLTLQSGGVEVVHTTLAEGTHIPFAVDSVSAGTATVIGLY